MARRVVVKNGTTYRGDSGKTYRITTFVSDPITHRYGVKVDGVVVGRGWASKDDAIERGREYARHTDAGRKDKYR